MIELKSNILVVTEVKKKSKAKMIGDLRVGDKIQLSVDASPVGSNRGTYATYIRIDNVDTGDYTFKSFNQIFDLYKIVTVE